MDDPKKAVAIKYSRDKDRAPKVLAKGRNEVAERIIQKAKESQVPVYPDQDLVQVLETLELNFEIPPELYRAVAEVLVFIYALNNRLP
ncbi:MAG: EscU/YscU/HrcU family type III secretion system export apparatus switch protein [Deltaproteobacteria bacterium]|nr:EscU/YscU/HrcU family type III secretion system export apparatus switch protein [Deltaproteobacteria bacterium]